MRFAGTKDSALAAQIIPFLARVIGESRQETVVVTICPREDLGLALKTVEKHVRRINDSAHEGLSRIYRFSVTDLSVPSAKPLNPASFGSRPPDAMPSRPPRKEAFSRSEPNSIVLLAPAWGLNEQRLT